MAAPKRDLAERFWEKVDFSPGQGPNGDCHEWKASRNKQGYGTFNIDGKIKGAARVAYSLIHGKIDESLDVCHSCDNPPCVNGAHLWQGTAQDNILDFVAKGKHYNTKKIHCRNGHPFSPENTLVHGRERVCRECARQACARFHEKKRRAS